MRNHSIIISIFSMACTTPYLTTLSDKTPEPSGEDTDSTQVITPVSDDDTTPEEVVDETDVDTDITETDTQDTEVEVIDHPTMDENGNPLYPTIPDDFEETGMIPPGDDGDGTVFECNLPENFMYVTYMDRDQDGSGSIPYLLPMGVVDRAVVFEPYASGAEICIYSEFSVWPYRSMGKFNPHRCDDMYPSHTYRDSGRVFPPTGNVETLAVCDGMAPDYNNCAPIGSPGTPPSPEPISNEAMDLFPEIYSQSTSVEMLFAAVEIINQEGNLGYDLTPVQAVTSHRKEYRDQLAYIAADRCEASPLCLSRHGEIVAVYDDSTNLYIYPNEGFDKEIFLTYATSGNLVWNDFSIQPHYDIQVTWIVESAFFATFFLGDSQTTPGLYLPSHNDMNQGLIDSNYLCDWASDDVDGDGYTLEQGDCHDRAAWIHPGAVEIPSNGADNNCDGFELCRDDADRDGYLGMTTVTIQGTICPNIGDRPTDCNDSNPNVNPGALEFACNGVDDNCDGQDM